jgi:transcriptional regulator with XRE-family HTH domain
MNSKNSINPVDEFSDFFATAPDVNEKAWGLIHDFYHAALTYMEENNISRSSLAAKMNKSRSAISQLFNKTPNITLKKMVEIADALDHNLRISFEKLHSEKEKMVDDHLKLNVCNFDNITPIDAIDDTPAKIIQFPTNSAANDFSSAANEDLFSMGNNVAANG